MSVLSGQHKRRPSSENRQDEEEEEEEEETRSSGESPGEIEEKKSLEKYSTTPHENTGTIIVTTTGQQPEPAN